MSTVKIFVVLFYLLQISSAFLLSPSHQISNRNHSRDVADLGQDIEEVCVAALGSDYSKDLNSYVYGCFLKKYNANQRNTVIEDFKLCCNLMSSKNRHDEELDCPNRFCECLDMINIVHQPFIKECTSSKLPQCELTSSSWGHDDKLREDVGIILVFKQNVMLGGGGIAIFCILSFISLLGFGYLVFICILYRCCQSKNDNNEIQEQQPQQYEDYYYAENGATYQYSDDGGYEMTDATFATTMTPQSTTTQSTTASAITTRAPLEQQRDRMCAGADNRDEEESDSDEFMDDGADNDEESESDDEGELPLDVKYPRDKYRRAFEISDIDAAVKWADYYCINVVPAIKSILDRYVRQKSVESIQMYCMGKFDGNEYTNQKGDIFRRGGPSELNLALKLSEIYATNGQNVEIFCQDPVFNDMEMHYLSTKGIIGSTGQGINERSFANADSVMLCMMVHGDYPIANEFIKYYSGAGLIHRIVFIGNHPSIFLEESPDLQGFLDKCRCTKLKFLRNTLAAQVFSNTWIYVYEDDMNTAEAHQNH